MPRTMIEGECPGCREELMMRLPAGMEQGTFSMECPKCDREMEVEIRKQGREGREVRIDGKQYRPPETTTLSEPSGGGGKKSTRKMVNIEMDLPYHRRMRLIFFLLLVVGILGIFSAFSTITGSFSINDLEEKSPDNLVSLSVWTIDAETGRPMEDVKVTVKKEERNYSATSDSRGLAVLEDLVTGKMQMTVEKEGYRTVSSGITVKKGSPNVVDIPMKRGNETEEEPILVHQFEPKKYSPFITNAAATLMLLASVLALTAAYFAYRKEFFLLVLAGSFLSIFSFGFLVGSVLATISLVLVIFSYDGFSHTHTLKRMLEGLRKRDLRGMLRSDQRQMSGLPPVRRR